MTRTLTLAIAALATAVAASNALANEDGKRAHGPRHLFERADADKDGVITRAEVDAMHAEMFARIDADGDGFASKEELAKAREKADQERKEKRMTKSQKRFQRMDADGDGQLSAEEFAARGAPMFERLDTDGDDAITREEIEAARGKRG